MPYSVVIKNFSFSPPRQKPKGVLENISLEIKAGEFVSLIARNGHGKTSIIRAIAGEIEQYVEGTVKVGSNFVIGPVHNHASGVGIVHQFVQDDLIFNLSISKNIQIRQLFSTDKYRRVNASDEFWEAKINEKLNEHLKGSEFTPTLDTIVDRLSGGQKQLLNILIAVDFEHSKDGGCKLLLLDEHLTSLDVITQKQVMDLIENLTRPNKRKRRKTTVIMVTHDFEYAIGHSDRIIVVYNGTIKEIINRNQSKKWNIDYLKEAIE